MEYKLSEQELKDLMHRTWLKAKKFYSGKTDEYFYDYFKSEKKQLLIQRVSQQRELLKAFQEYYQTGDYNDEYPFDENINRFLKAFNCG